MRVALCFNWFTSSYSAAAILADRCLFEMTRLNMKSTYLLSACLNPLRISSICFSLYNFQLQPLDAHLAQTYWPIWCLWDSINPQMSYVFSAFWCLAFQSLFYNLSMSWYSSWCLFLDSSGSCSPRYELWHSTELLMSASPSMISFSHSSNSYSILAVSTFLPYHC